MYGAVTEGAEHQSPPAAGFFFFFFFFFKQAWGHVVLIGKSSSGACNGEEWVIFTDRFPSHLLPFLFLLQVWDLV